MAKTKTPFLSFGAQGSVGESITAQKRPAFTMLREKPFPTDPYSLPQAYQRWLYEDYAYLWTQQSTATKQICATAGSRLHLTGFQYWMKIRLTLLPDIAAWWKLDPPNITTTPDSSRNNHTATIFGAIPATFVINGSLYLDGINDYLTIPYTGNLILNSPFSMEMFLRGYNTGTHLRLISCRVTPWTNNNWYANLGGARQFQVLLNLTSGEVIYTNTTIIPWETVHHVGFSYDDPTLILYVDGVGQSFTTPGGPLITAPSTLYIGVREDLIADFKGDLDNIILYSRALDAATFLRHSQRQYPPGAPIYPPFGVAIDIGSPAINRPVSEGHDWYTVILKENPANASGTLHTVEIYCFIALTGCRVGTFYTTNGNTLKCRDSTVIGNVPSGSKQTFAGLSIAVQAGDYIGYYASKGMEQSLAGFAGYWYKSGEFIDPNDEANYSFVAGRTISLYGIG